MADTVPITGVITGPRACTGTRREPARVVWAEALDGGDLKNRVQQRDKLMAIEAPFTAAPRELLRTEFRFTQHQLDRCTGRARLRVRSPEASRSHVDRRQRRRDATAALGSQRRGSLWRSRRAAPAHRRPHHSSGGLEHLPRGRRRVTEGRSSVPRSPRSRHASDDAPLQVDRRQLRSHRRRAGGRWRPGADASRDEQRSAQLHRPDARGRAVRDARADHREAIRRRSSPVCRSGS